MTTPSRRGLKKETIHEPLLSPPFRMEHERMAINMENNYGKKDLI
jgi:hypothetical protein